MYTVASPDPNPRGGGQLPNPNEWNSTLTSEIKNIYLYLYIDLGKWVAGYELSMRDGMVGVKVLQRQPY